MISEIDEKIEQMMQQYIAEHCKVGDRDRTGIDPRAFSKFWYNDDCIIIYAGDRRQLDYYGGFEYIDSDNVREYGDYVVYSYYADRVQDVIDCLEEEIENA